MDAGQTFVGFDPGRTLEGFDPGNVFAGGAMIPTVTLLKRAGWSRQYVFDFSAFAELQGASPQTLSGPSVPAVTGLTLGSPSVSGATVLVQVSGGTAGTTYAVTCSVTTSGGATLTITGNLEVVA